MNKPFIIYPIAHENIRSYRWYSQLWFEDTVLRNCKLYKKYVDEGEWTQLDDDQVESYKFTEFKHWKKHGLNPPSGLKNDLRYYSIIEYLDFMSVDKKSILEYKIEFEYKEVGGDWTPEVWQKQYFVDVRAVAETVKTI